MYFQYLSEKRSMKKLPLVPLSLIYKFLVHVTLQGDSRLAQDALPTKEVLTLSNTPRYTRDLQFHLM